MHPYPFFRTELKLTETVEKIGLPDVEAITSEKKHLDHLTGLESGVDLKKTETREPLNPLDLARLEITKDQVEEDIQAFDRYIDIQKISSPNVGLLS